MFPRRSRRLRIRADAAARGTEALRQHLSLYTGADGDGDGVPLRELEEALAVVRSRGGASAALVPAEEAGDDAAALRRRLHEARSSLLTSQQQAERAERLLRTQRELARDLEEEVKDLTRRLEQGGDGAAQRLRRYEEACRRKEEVIRALRAKVTALTAAAGRRLGPLELADGAADGAAGDDDDDGASVATASTAASLVVAPGGLAPSETLIEVYVVSAELFTGADASLGDLATSLTSLFAVVDFWDFESQASPAAAPPFPAFNFASRFRVPYDEALAWHAAEPGAAVTVDLFAARDADARLVGRASLPLRALLASEKGAVAFRRAPLLSRGGAVVGVLRAEVRSAAALRPLWNGLRRRLPADVEAMEGRWAARDADAARGEGATAPGAPSGPPARVAELIVRVVEARGLPPASSGAAPSPYVDVRLPAALGLPPRLTARASATDAPVWEEALEWPVPVDRAGLAALAAGSVRLVVVDDADRASAGPDGTEGVVGTASLAASALAEGASLRRWLRLVSPSGAAAGTVLVEAHWRDGALAAAGAMPDGAVTSAQLSELCSVFSSDVGGVTPGGEGMAGAVRWAPLGASLAVLCGGVARGMGATAVAGEEAGARSASLQRCRRALSRCEGAGVGWAAAVLVAGEEAGRPGGRLTVEEAAAAVRGCVARCREAEAEGTAGGAIAGTALVTVTGGRAGVVVIDSDPGEAGEAMPASSEADARTALAAALGVMARLAAAAASGDALLAPPPAADGADDDAAAAPPTMTAADVVAVLAPRAPRAASAEARLAQVCSSLAVAASATPAVASLAPGDALLIGVAQLLEAVRSESARLAAAAASSSSSSSGGRAAAGRGSAERDVREADRAAARSAAAQDDGGAAPPRAVGALTTRRAVWATLERLGVDVVDAGSAAGRVRGGAAAATGSDGAAAARRAPRRAAEDEEDEVVEPSAERGAGAASSDAFRSRAAAHTPAGEATTDPVADPGRAHTGSAHPGPAQTADPASAEAEGAAPAPAPADETGDAPAPADAPAPDADPAADGEPSAGAGGAASPEAAAPDPAGAAAAAEAPAPADVPAVSDAALAWLARLSPAVCRAAARRSRLLRLVDSVSDVNDRVKDVGGSDSTTDGLGPWPADVGSMAAALSRPPRSCRVRRARLGQIAGRATGAEEEAAEEGAEEGCEAVGAAAAEDGTADCLRLLWALRSRGRLPGSGWSADDAAAARDAWTAGGDDATAGRAAALSLLRLCWTADLSAAAVAGALGEAGAVTPASLRAGWPALVSAAGDAGAPEDEASACVAPASDEAASHVVAAMAEAAGVALSDAAPLPAHVVAAWLHVADAAAVPALVRGRAAASLAERAAADAADPPRTGSKPRRAVWDAARLLAKLSDGRPALPRRRLDRVIGAVDVTVRDAERDAAAAWASLHAPLPAGPAEPAAPAGDESDAAWSAADADVPWRPVADEVDRAVSGAGAAAGGIACLIPVAREAAAAGLTARGSETAGSALPAAEAVARAAAVLGWPAAGDGPAWLGRLIRHAASLRRGEAPPPPSAAAAASPASGGMSPREAAAAWAAVEAASGPGAGSVGVPVCLVAREMVVGLAASCTGSKPKRERPTDRAGVSSGAGDATPAATPAAEAAASAPDAEAPAAGAAAAPAPAEAAAAPLGYEGPPEGDDGLPGRSVRIKVTGVGDARADRLGGDGAAVTVQLLWPPAPEGEDCAWRRAGQGTVAAARRRVDHPAVRFTWPTCPDGGGTAAVRRALVAASRAGAGPDDGAAEVRVVDADGRVAGSGRVSLSRLLEGGKDVTAQQVPLTDADGRPVATAVVAVSALRALEIARSAGGADSKAWGRAGRAADAASDSGSVDSSPRMAGGGAGAI